MTARMPSRRAAIADEPVGSGCRRDGTVPARARDLRSRESCQAPDWTGHRVRQFHHGSR